MNKKNLRCSFLYFKGMVILFQKRLENLKKVFYERMLDDDDDANSGLGNDVRDEI